MPRSSSRFPKTTTDPNRTAARATSPPPTDSARGPPSPALPVDKLDPYPFEGLALVLGLRHADPSDLGRRSHVGPAVRLFVEPLDVDHADRVHLLGDQVHL